VGGLAGISKGERYLQEKQVGSGKQARGKGGLGVSYRKRRKWLKGTKFQGTIQNPGKNDFKRAKRQNWGADRKETTTITGKMRG